MWTKVRNLEKMCKRLFSEKENSDHVECMYRTISKLISIKVLWELFYPNTWSRWTLNIIHSSYIFFPCHLFLPSPSCSIYGLDTFFPILYLKAWTVIRQVSAIELVFWLILTACLCHLALANTDDILKGR